MKLSPRQAEIMDFIREHHVNTGETPTRQEIANHFGIDQSTATDHVTALRLKGYITVLPGKARGIMMRAV